MSRDHADPSDRGGAAKETERDRRGEALGFGLFLIGLATAMNFLLDGMGPDDVAQMPWFIAVAFESGGKLGVTLLLCGIGVLCIVWGVVNTPSEGRPKLLPVTPRAVPVRAAPETPPPAVPVPAAPIASTPSSAEQSESLEPAEQCEQFEEAEVVAEEIPGEADGAPKIPAIGGHYGAPGGRGAMVLDSAKYFGGARPGNFRKGGERHTNTE